MSRIYALSSVKFFGLKLRLCKKRTNIRYARTSWPGCPVVGNKFIVAGGEDKNGNSLKSTEIIDLRTRNITAGGGMEKPRGMFNLLSISGTLYALGGLHHDGKRNFSANDGGFFTTHTLITLVVSIMMDVFFDHLYSHLFVEIYEALLLSPLNIRFRPRV